MRKVFSILFTGILLASGLQISVDRHYCGGELAGTKLSVTGKMASCGMETAEHACPIHPTYNKKCCEDQITFYSIGGKYFPESFEISHPTTGTDIPFAPVSNIVLKNSDLSDLISQVIPPGDKLKSSLTLSEICVFRI